MHVYADARALEEWIESRLHIVDQPVDSALTIVSISCTAPSNRSQPTVLA